MVCSAVDGADQAVAVTPDEFELALLMGEAEPRWELPATTVYEYKDWRFVGRYGEWDVWVGIYIPCNESVLALYNGRQSYRGFRMIREWLDEVHRRGIQTMNTVVLEDGFIYNSSNPLHYLRPGDRSC